MTRLNAVNLKQYYNDQAGGRLDAYTSYRYLPSQRGAGFFGRLIKGTFLPLLKQVLPYAKNTALTGVEDLVSGLREGKSFKESGSSALKKAAGTMFSDATRELGFQKGSGIKKGRKRRRKRKPAAAKRKVNRKNTAVKRKRKPGKRTKSTLRSVLFP